MEREDLYYLKQIDVDARFVDIVSGGGATSLATAPASHVVAAPRTPMYKLVCSLCGRFIETPDPKAVAWCSHRGRADNNKPTLMRKVDRGRA